MTDPANDPGERPQLTAYLVEFGNRLERAEARPTLTAAGRARTRRAGRRWRRPLTVTAGLAAAGLFTAFVAVPAFSPVDPVTEARAALGDPGDLVHFVVLGSDGARRGDDSSPCAQRRTTEVWQATSGTPRWRVVALGMPERCGIMSTWDGTRTRGTVERARDGGTQTTWYPQIGRLEVITQTGNPTGSDYPALLFGGPEPGNVVATSGDPIGRLRALLDEGTLREGRRNRIDGREVVHLVGTTSRGGTDSRFDLAVDARTFIPVRFTTRFLSDFLRLNPGVGDTADGWSTWTTDFVIYEQRPMTPAGARELTVRPQTKPATEFRLTESQLKRRVKALDDRRFRTTRPLG